MNYRIANNEVCKALIDRENVRGYDIDDNTVFVTADGFCGFIIPKKEIVYDYTKVRQMKKLFDVSEYIKPENEIKPTYNYFKAGKEYCRRFDGKDYYVFVQDKFLKKLEKDIPYYYFQNVEEGKDMRKQSVVAAVKEYTGDNEYRYVPVMILLPINILDYEKEK